MKKITPNLSGYYKFATEFFAIFLVYCGYPLAKIEYVNKKQLIFCFKESEFADDPSIRGNVIASLTNAFLTGEADMDLEGFIEAKKDIQNIINKNK